MMIPPHAAVRSTEASRFYKVLRVSQAHLAPNMSLEKWTTILDEFSLSNNLDNLTDDQLDKLVRRIAMEVTNAG